MREAYNEIKQASTLTAISDSFYKIIHIHNTNTQQYIKKANTHLTILNQAQPK